MNFKRWEFSKQVQSELEKFLKIVENNKTNQNVGELVEKVLPKLSLSHYKFEPMKVESHDDIITIDSDEDIKTEENTEKAVISLNIDSENISVTILSLSDAREEKVEQDITKFKSTIKECLNDNKLLENDDIQRIFNELNNENIIDLLNFLYEDVDDFGLLNLGGVLNKFSFKEDLVRQYCKLIYLKKLLKTESSEFFMPLVNIFTKNFPSIFREEILLSLLNEYFEHVHIFKTIYEVLPKVEKEILIREFLFSCQELEESHLLILQPIIPELIDFAIKQRLINLMSISADKFKENKIFMKMFIEIIKTLNKDFLDLEPILYSIIEKNKTIFKVSAEKTLNMWFNECNVD